MDDFKTVELRGIKIAYSDTGAGRPVLMTHGATSISYTWKRMIENMSGEFRYIILDLKSQGRSEMILDDHLSPFDQSAVLTDFIQHLDLHDILLVGHALGGCVNLLVASTPETSERITGLVLLDSFGMFTKVPDLVADCLISTGYQLFEKYVKSIPNFVPLFILEETYYDKERITNETMRAYLDAYSGSDTRKCILASLRQILISNLTDFYNRLQGIKIKTLIIWGEEDSIFDVENAFHFKDAIPYSTLKIIPACGHAPQEECPEETATSISRFLGVDDTATTQSSREDDEIEKSPVSAPAAPLPLFKERNFKLRRLFTGRWGIVAILFLLLLKSLQYIKRFTGIAKENGWRRITQIFLRKEHSKFCLASFRLNYLKDHEKVDYKKAKLIVVAKLFKFIKNNPIFHWRLDHKAFTVLKKHNEYVDIIVAEFDESGKLLKLEPHFDNHTADEIFISSGRVEKVCELLTNCYNETIDIDDKKRVAKLNRILLKSSLKAFKENGEWHKAVLHYGKRILQGTFLHFQKTTEESGDCLSSERLDSPDFNKIKHPGEGLLNIFCRFSPDIREVDLWFQFHHVPVDGMPMQEMLGKLKKQWGAAGPVVYPALSSATAAPEVKPAGENMYRGRIFCDFSSILAVRKKLNKEYYNEMCGPAPLPALLMWGIAEHADFKGYKFSMPVDTATLDAQGMADERSISLIFIKPELYYDENAKSNGLIDFIREFNYQIHLTRIGKSESYELIEFGGMLHPLLTAGIRKFFPKTFGEVTGNAGLTIIKNAEMFITPLTELQSSGFIAIGNCRIPTADGKHAGAISVCGDEKLVRSYVTAIKDVTDNYERHMPAMPL